MDFIGEIVAEQDGAGIDKRQWIDLIREHPNLIPPEPRETINPFTKERILIKPLPDVARLIIDGEEVGAMSWSMDDSNLIHVFGKPGNVSPLAQEVARLLGGRFRATNEQ
jgi:hypothetical protein